MVNNRYHLLYNIASSAPPAGVVLSRFLGGGIGRTNVYERILREPTGIEFIDNQIMRESGVSGMKPMNEDELKEYIKMWLQGLVRNPETKSLADLKDEMDRVRGALAAARMFYQAHGGEAKDDDIAKVLDALETAYYELRKIKTSLEREQETDLLREMEIRSKIDSAKGDERKMLQAELAGLIQKRKGNEDRERELAEVRQAQALALKQLDESWIDYLKQLMEELGVARDTLDLTNPRNHFMRILREQIDQAKQADQPNVTSYLQLIETALGRIVNGDMVDDGDMLPEESMYKGLNVLLNDIRAYYADTKREKELIQQALQTANERIRKMQAQVSDLGLVKVETVAEMLEQLLNRVQQYAATVKDLQEELRAQTTELEASQATVLKLQRANEMYAGILRDIRDRFVLDEHKAQVLADFSNLPGYIEQYMNSIRDQIGKSEVKSEAQGKELIALNTILKEYLEPLNRLLELFVGKVGGVQVIYPDAANQLLKRLRELAQTAQQAALNATGQIPEKITLVITTINLIVDLIGRYEREKESFNIFFNEVRNKLKRPEAQPDEALLLLEGLNKRLEISGEQLQANAAKIADLGRQIADLTAARETDKTNMETLREQNAADLRAAKERLKAVQEEMERNRTASEEEKARVQHQLDEALAQIQANQAELEAAQSDTVEIKKLYEKQLADATEKLRRAQAQEEELARVAKENEVLKEQKAKMQEELREARGQIAEKKEAYKKLFSEVTKLRARVLELDTLKGQVGNNTAANKALNEEYQKALTALNVATQQLNQLQASYNESMTQAKALSDEIFRLKEQERINEEKIAAGAELLRQYEERERKLKSELSEYRQKLVDYETERALGPLPYRFRDLIGKVLNDPYDLTNLMEMFTFYYALGTGQGPQSSLPDQFQINYDLLTGIFLRIDFKRMKVVNKRVTTLYEIFYLLVFALTGMWMSRVRTTDPRMYDVFLNCNRECWKAVILQGGSSHISLSACWDVVLGMITKPDVILMVKTYPQRAGFLYETYQAQIDIYAGQYKKTIEDLEESSDETFLKNLETAFRDIRYNGGLGVPDVLFLSCLIWKFTVQHPGEYKKYSDCISEWTSAAEFFVRGNRDILPIGKLINTRFGSREQLLKNCMSLRMCAETPYYDDNEALKDLDLFTQRDTLTYVLRKICELFK